ncbi:MAG TPA: non-homologous end-joining DNA ligase [Pyrinomonadaceae bacterium]|nr:non-homologous end-joining DNA ligase [Pyrinomonadaceae bacterium]
MGLETYQKMRDFRRTPEPRGTLAKRNLRRFVVQEHHASMLHFDFRLEIDGVLKSWSVRRGPSLDPSERRLAVETEDHPVEYAKFEGVIPEGEYGAGRHMIWDEGKYELVEGDDAAGALEAGRLKFRLNGRKLRGEFNLVRMGGREGQWLLIKGRDEFAEPGWQLELRVADDDVARAWLAGVEKKAAKRGASGAPARVVSDPKGVKKFSTKAGGERKAVPAARLFKSKELSGDVSARVGREVVPLTSLDRVYWPDDGLTKADLIRYYYEVSKFILPYLKGRPLIMKRYPAGIRGQSFHQHDVDEVPRFVPTVALEVEDGGGHEVDYIVGDNLPTLLYMANLGAIERHPWHSRTRSLDRPDWFVFDLDPSEGVEFTTICELAVVVREALEEIGLKSYPKTSGSRGIHIYVPVKPVYDYGQIARLAEQVATEVARRRADIATVERSIRKRGEGAIYVDHMQNARGKSVVAPYSVRPRPGATVSAPLTWDEVARAKITPQDFTIKNVLARIRRKGDLFRPVLDKRQTLTRAFGLAEGVSAAGRRARRARA